MNLTTEELFALRAILYRIKLDVPMTDEQKALAKQIYDKLCK